MKIFILEDEIYCMRHHGGGPSPRSSILQDVKGHDVTVCESINEAMEKWDPPYDLLLLDHDMEGHFEFNPDHHNTGMVWLRWLLKDGWTKGIPKPWVILHTWNDEARKRQRKILEANGFRPERIIETYFSSSTYSKLFKETVEKMRSCR